MDERQKAISLEENIEDNFGKRRPVINQRLGDLDAMLTDLDNAITTLVQALEPVLTSESNRAPEDVRQLDPAQSPVARWVQNMCQRVEEMSDVVKDIKGKLEV